MASTYLLSKLSSSADPPNPANSTVKGLLTALSALVPAEVIALSSSIAGYLTKTDDQGHVYWAHAGLARYLMFVVGVVVIPLIYLVGADSKSGGPALRTVGLLLISIVAYGGWLALQTPSVYDGWWGTSGQVGDSGSRAAVLAVVVLILGVFAGLLGRAPNPTPPNPAPPNPITPTPPPPGN